jgi:type I restriction enzyme S subunit
MYTTAGKRIANEGETLISVRAPVGDTNQATEECVIGRGVAAAIHKSGSQVFTYSLLTHLKPQLEYYNGEGTVFGAINRKDFETLSFVEPANAEVSAFEKLLGATNTQIRNLHDQTTSLTSLRDSLLPRLISGELEIPAELLEA